MNLIHYRQIHLYVHAQNNFTIPSLQLCFIKYHHVMIVTPFTTNLIHIFHNYCLVTPLIVWTNPVRFFSQSILEESIFKMIKSTQQHTSNFLAAINAQIPPARFIVLHYLVMFQRSYEISDSELNIFCSWNTTQQN